MLNVFHFFSFKKGYLPFHYNIIFRTSCKSVGFAFISSVIFLFVLKLKKRRRIYNFSISFMVKPVIRLIVSISIFSFFIDFAMV